MSEQRLQQLADSAILKVLQYIITGIAVPLIGYGLASIADRLAQIDRAVAAFTTTNATIELRVRALENTQAERTVQLRALQEKSTAQEVRLQRVEDQIDPTRPRR